MTATNAASLRARALQDLREFYNDLFVSDLRTTLHEVLKAAEGVEKAAKRVGRSLKETGVQLDDLRQQFPEPNGDNLTQHITNLVCIVEGLVETVHTSSIVAPDQASSAARTGSSSQSESATVTVEKAETPKLEKAARSLVRRADLDELRAEITPMRKVAYWNLATSVGGWLGIGALLLLR